MNTIKELFFFIIIAMILFLFGGYTVLDWFQFSRKIADYKRPEIPYVRTTKVTVSFLAAILVFMIGKDGFNERDTIMLVIAYAVILIGDLFLVFDINLVGTAAFALSHVFFILRNGSGITMYIKDSSLINRLYDIVSFVVIIGIIVTVLRVFFYPRLKGNPFFYVLLGYGLFLGVSLWTAWATLRIGFMPERNALLVAIGMTCFFISDLLVGVHFATEPGNTQLIARYTTWIFYTPALVFLALSGYDLSKIF